MKSVIDNGSAAVESMAERLEEATRTGSESCRGATDCSRTG